MTDGDSFHTPPALPPASKIGLAVASLVLGIVALALSFLGIGLILGALGVVFGAMHLAGERGGRTMAGWGLGLSIAGVIASVGFIGLYAFFFYQFMPMMDYGEFMETESVSEWEGVRAPDFTVTALDGAELTLADLQGKRVIVDVWATWCPPCVREVPHFIQLAKDIPPEDLVIIGVSDEPEDTIRLFADKEGVNYAMASFDALPEPYGNVVSVPTTFMIDRQGVIQQVLQGYHDYETLHAAATMADFAGTPLDEPVQPSETLLAPAQALEAREQWSTEVSGALGMCSGDWNGDGVSDLLVSTDAPGLRVLGQDGAEIDSVRLPEAYNLIELGKYHGQPRLLGHSNWGNSIAVVDKAGKEAWSYSSWMGVNGAHWFDADGDGTDEMVAGMNGGGGLHLISAEGKKLWKVGLGNVWNQAAVRSASGKALVLATEAGGSVRMFDPDGERAGSVNSYENYFTEIAAALIDGGESIQILAGGTEQTVAMDAGGRALWSTPAEEDHGAWRSVRFASGDANGDGRLDWAFHGLDGVMLIVSASGEKLAELPDQEALSSFAFAGGLLATLNGDAITGYAFHPIAAAASPEPPETTPETTPEVPVPPPETVQ